MYAQDKNIDMNITNFSYPRCAFNNNVLNLIQRMVSIFKNVRFSGKGRQSLNK